MTNFCTGEAGRCVVCGALYIEGDWQRCPSPVRLRRGSVLKRVVISKSGPYVQPTPEECPHLGSSTGESALVFGCGCGASRENGIEVTVFECDLHGKCVTYIRGTLAEGSTLKRCLGCLDNPQVKASNVK